MGRLNKNWDIEHMTMVCTGAVGLLSTWEEDLRAEPPRGVKPWSVISIHPGKVSVAATALCLEPAGTNTPEI